MPSPMVRVYERAAGWMTELWAASQDGDGAREEALLEQHGPYPRWLDAWLKAGEAMRRAVDKDGGSR